jgi:hypothetical protein
MSRVLAAALVAAVFLAAPPTLSGQSTEFSFASGWLNPGGEDFADTRAGPGFDVVLRRSLGARATLGLGGTWSMHGVDFTDDKYDVLGVFVEPRVLAGSGESPARPFVAGRLAWMRESIREGTQSRAANGVGGGLLAGVLVPVSDRVTLEGSVGGYLLSFGDFKADGVPLSRDGGSGNAWALRVAVNVTP